MSRRVGTPRISAPAPVEPPARDRGPEGPPGPPGLTGPSGTPSPYIEIVEATSGPLFGPQQHGFVRRASSLVVECGFEGWNPGDLLLVDFFVALACESDQASGYAAYQVQLSLDSGRQWHALRGAEARIGASGYGGVATGGIALTECPLVRLHATDFGAGLDHGPGPDAGLITLRCYRLRAGTFQPSGELVPPRR